MDSHRPESPCGNWQYAGENLKRRKTSSAYYGFAKVKGKQFSVVGQFETRNY
jgi:hypothetical protein